MSVILKLVFQPFAVGAVGVGEDGDFQLAVAAHFFDGFVEGQAVEFHRAQFGVALVGEAFAVFHVDKVAHQHIVGLRVGVHHGFAAEHHFIQVRQRGGVNGLHFDLLLGVGFFQFGADVFFHGGVEAGGGRGLGGGFRAVVGDLRLVFAAGGQHQEGGGKGGHEFSVHIFLVFKVAKGRHYAEKPPPPPAILHDKSRSLRHNPLVLPTEKPLWL